MLLFLLASSVVTNVPGTTAPRRSTAPFIFATSLAARCSLDGEELLFPSRRLRWRGRCFRDARWKPVGHVNGGSEGGRPGVGIRVGHAQQDVPQRWIELVPCLRCPAFLVFT